MTYARVLLSVLLMIALLALISCTQGQITNTLQVAITAAEIAIPVVAGQTGIDPAITTAATKYLQTANDALGIVTQELGSTDPAAVQAAKITAALAGVTKADLPAGTPQLVADAINKVATAIVQLLGNFATPNGTPKLLNPKVRIKLSEGDLATLKKAAVEIGANQKAISKLLK